MTSRRSRAAQLVAIAVTVVVVLAGAVSAHAKSAMGEIRGADGVAAQGSYLVVFKDQAGSSAIAMTARYGGQVDRVYRSALNGFAATMPEATARALAADPAVKYVQRNTWIGVSVSSGHGPLAGIQDTQPNPPSWGLDRIDQRGLPLDDSYTYPTTAGNVHAYVIATGIRFSHNEFAGRAVSGYDFVDDDADADDCNGVGTYSAGVIGGTSYGVAKEVTLVGVRVLSCSGSGTTADVLAGIDWVTEHAVKPAVAHLPLGGSANQALDDAVRSSIASGVTYAVPSSTGGTSACDYSPSRVPEAITVGGTDSSDAVLTSSGGGECLDLFAPGGSIPSAWHSDDTATRVLSGRTAASAHAAGVAALLASQNPDWTAGQVHDQVIADGTEGVLNGVPADTANLLLFVDNGSVEPMPPTASFTASCKRVWIWRYCDFDGRASADPDGTIVSYSWDFGDGEPGSGATARHWYGRAGNYAVTLTVTDDAGYRGTTTKHIEVP